MSAPWVQAHIASLHHDLGKLRSVQKELEQATASLERYRQMHAMDREQILHLQDEVRAFSDSEKQLLLAQVWHQQFGYVLMS